MTRATKLIEPNVISKFLGIDIIDNNFISIDMWSFVHLLSGAFLFFIVNLTRFSLPNKITIAIVLLISYELFEFIFVGVFFSKETLVNSIWDIIIAMIGFAIMFLLFSK
jgi:hypothetical protein